MIPTPTIVRRAIKQGNIPSDSPRKKKAAIVTKMGLQEPITAASAILRYFSANNTRNRFVQPIDARNYKISKSVKFPATSIRNKRACKGFVDVEERLKTRKLTYCNFDERFPLAVFS